MTAGIPGDALAAALLQIASHAERIGGLDAREAAHYQEIAAAAAPARRRGRFPERPHRRALTKRSAVTP